MVEKGKPYNPFQWQATHFHANRHKKRLAAACGRRAGKSAAMKGEIVAEISRPPELIMGVLQSPLVYVIGPTAETSMKVWQPVWDLFVPPESGSYSPPLGFMHEDHNKQRRWIKLRNGAELFGKTADDPRSLQGDRVTLAVVDEAHEIQEEAWENLMPSLADSGGRLIAIGIPRGRGRFRSYWELGQGEDPNFYSFSVPTSANPIFTEQALAAGYSDTDQYIREQFAADLTDDEFQRQYMAVWTEQDGQVFKDYEPVFTARRGGAHIGQNNAMGLDIGKVVDPTALYIGDIKTGKFLTDDYFLGLDYTVAVPRIAKMYRAYNCQYIHADITGGGIAVVDMLRAEGCIVIPFVFTNQSKAGLVMTFAREIEKRRVSLLSDDTILRKEMAVFEAVVKGTNVFYGHPRGYHDDRIMAAALLVDRMALRHKYGQARVTSYATFRAPVGARR